MIAINTDVDHLVESHLRLAERMASRRRTLCRLVGEDEAFSVAMGALWTAAKKFDPARMGEQGFAGFASNCISRKLTDRTRKARRSRDDMLPRASADFIPDRREVNGRDCRVTLLLSGRMSPQSLGIEAESLRWALEHLPTDMVRLLSDRFGLDGATPMTHSEIGAQWGIAESTISRHVEQAIDELRMMLQAESMRHPSARSTQAQTATDAHSSPSE